VRRIFKENDFSHVDDVNAERRQSNRGANGFKASALFRALLLMYLKQWTILELIKFLDQHKEWLYFLDLKRMKDDKMQYVVPNRTTFYPFIRRLGEEALMEIFIRTVIQLKENGIINGDNISVDATIISAWFLKGKRKDRDAKKGYDSYRKIWVVGYKIHILLDVDTALPIGVMITPASSNESKTLIPFVQLINERYRFNVHHFLADAQYDSNKNRKEIINELKAVPVIDLNPRNCKGNTKKEKKARRKKLCEKFYKKEWIHEYWLDPNSEKFDKLYDMRTFSEQMFSVSRGSLKGNDFRFKGKLMALAHAVLMCMGTLVVANTAVAVGRPDLMRCVKCFTV